MIVVHDEDLDMYVREPSHDRAEITKKRKWYEQVPLVKADRVLEVGAFIGGFTRYAAARVDHVVAYEPVKSSYDLAVRNTAHLDNVTLCNSALVGSKRDTLPLYVNAGGWLQGASAYITRNCARMVVHVERFQDVIDEYLPTVLSMDCEGGEYDTLLYAKVPASVRLIDLEVHVRRNEWRQTTAYQLIAQLEVIGFRADVLPPIKKHWAESSIKTLWRRA